MADPSSVKMGRYSCPRRRRRNTASRKRGAFLLYKGRAYCWTEISPAGQIRLTEATAAFLQLRPGMSLLSIRSSDIAFTMGAKGPLLEKAENFDGEIPKF